jgi:signal transduction histidine kinase
MQLAIFRVAQEALTNTLKHAARPTSAHLELSRRGDAVELDVTNTGGPNEGVSAPGGRGLRGMHERALAYGGELDVGPTDDGGWRVHLRLAADVPPNARSLEPVR